MTCPISEILTFPPDSRAVFILRTELSMSLYKDLSVIITAAKSLVDFSADFGYADLIAPVIVFAKSLVSILIFIFEKLEVNLFASLSESFIIPSATAFDIAS